MKAITYVRMQQLTNRPGAARRDRRPMIFYFCALILGAALCLAVSRAARAECQGHDLFVTLKSEAPTTYAAHRSGGERHALQTGQTVSPFPRRKRALVSFRHFAFVRSAHHQLLATASRRPHQFKDRGFGDGRDRSCSSL